MNPVDEPGTEEELEPGSRRRLRLDLIVGAAVLVAIVLVGKAIAGNQSNPGPAASASPVRTTSGVASTPASAGPGSVFVTQADGRRLKVPALPRRASADPAACPDRVTCSTRLEGPEYVVDAIGTRLPKAMLQRGKSVWLRSDPWAGMLWFRQLDYLIDNQVLTVQIFARGDNARADGGQIGGLLFVRTALEQYEVTVRADARSGVTLQDLRAIAADHRLLTG